MQHITVRSEFCIANWNHMLLGSSFEKKSSLSPNYAPCKDLALLQPILCDFLFSSALQHLYSSCIRMSAATAI